LVISLRGIGDAQESRVQGCLIWARVVETHLDIDPAFEHSLDRDRVTAGFSERLFQHDRQPIVRRTKLQQDIDRGRLRSSRLKAPAPRPVRHAASGQGAQALCR